MSRYQRLVMALDAQQIAVQDAHRRLWLRQLQQSHADEPAFVLECAAYYRTRLAASVDEAIAQARHEYEQLKGD